MCIGLEIDDPEALAGEPAGRQTADHAERVGPRELLVASFVAYPTEELHGISEPERLRAIFERLA